MPSENLFSLGLFTQAEASIITKIGNNYSVRRGLLIRKVNWYDWLDEVLLDRIARNCKDTTTHYEGYYYTQRLSFYNFNGQSNILFFVIIHLLGHNTPRSYDDHLWRTWTLWRPRDQDKSPQLGAQLQRSATIHWLTLVYLDFAIIHVWRWNDTVFWIVIK